jgi:hypothetical protein
MIVHVSSDFIPGSYVDDFVTHVTSEVVPSFKASPDLISVFMWRRHLVGYVEISIVSVWQNEEAMTSCLQTLREIWSRGNFASIRTEPRVYSITVL